MCGFAKRDEHEDSYVVAKATSSASIGDELFSVAILNDGRHCIAPTINAALGDLKLLRNDTMIGPLPAGDGNEPSSEIYVWLIAGDKLRAVWTVAVTTAKSLHLTITRE